MDLGFGIAREASIEHGVGDLVADFVRVTFLHGLRRKEEDTFSPRRHDTDFSITTPTTKPAQDKLDTMHS